MDDLIVRMGHGSGGRLTRDLIKEIFVKNFDNPALNKLGDAAVFSITGDRLAFTTDSYVIDPIFFPGGDIGKLAVSGTINDLCVSGADAKYMSVGIILEEGFSIESLTRIAESMAKEAGRAQISIVTGDTKVVKKGQCDKIFINTTGIGTIPDNRQHLSNGTTIEAGDIIIISGTLGDHAIAILSAREHLMFEEEIISDTAPLIPLTKAVLTEPSEISFMRDVTRGGLATVLVEACEKRSFGIEIDEKMIPIKRSVKSVCELYGFDPMYLANEGKMMMIVKPKSAGGILNRLKNESLGTDASIIGVITSSHPGQAVLKSVIGGRRMIDMFSGEMLPRIC
jgi:hydrogenase expression/formation protein HypE